MAPREFSADRGPLPLLILPRGETAALVGASERSGRRMVSALVEAGVLTAESSRAPLKLAFPAALAGRWMPGLFPEMTAG